MKNKIAKLVLATTILSSIVVPFSNAQAEENDIQQKEVQVPIIENKAPSTEPIITENPNGTLMIQDGGEKVIIHDGGFDWKWLNSYDGDNVAYNNFDYYIKGALMAGLGGSIAGILVSGWAKGVASYIAGQVGLSIPRNQNIWFTVHKLYDYDAVNVYVKYRVWIYSDPSRSRSSIIKFYEEVHRT